MVVAWSSTLAKASFVNQGTSLGASFTSQYHQIQRSDDEGVTWDYIRDGENITLNASNQSVIEDYEAPRGITAYYRCRAVAVDVGLYLHIGACTPLARERSRIMCREQT
jgi:hypothetical protein